MVLLVVTNDESLCSRVRALLPAGEHQVERCDPCDARPERAGSAPDALLVEAAWWLGEAGHAERVRAAYPWPRVALVTTAPTPAERHELLRTGIHELFDLGAGLSLAETLGLAISRQAASARLESRNQLLTVAQDVTKSVVWDWDLQTDLLRLETTWPTSLWSPEAPRTGEALLAAVHPDDIGQLKRAWHQPLRIGGSLDAEFRIQGAHGSARWVAATGTVLTNAQGRPVRAAGVIADIHARKTMDLTLRFVVEQAASADRSDFVVGLTRAVAQATGVQCAFVGEFTLERIGAVRTIAVWDRGGTAPSMELDLADMLHDLSETGQVCVASGALTRYPSASFLRSMGCDAFACVLLLGPSDESIGVLGVAHPTAPDDATTSALPLLRTFAPRASAELQRQRAERALRISEHRYRVLHESNPIMLFTLSRDGNVLDVNPSGAAQLGYSPHELVGRSVFEVLRPEFYALASAHVAECFARPGEVIRWHLTKRHKDGHDVFVEESATVMPDAAGTGPELLVACMDVSERVLSENALRFRGEQLRHVQKMEAMTTLAGGVAHDLNNLLTAIRGYVSLASRTLPEGHPAAASLNHVEDAARQAAGVVSSLRTFAGKGGSSKHPLELSRVLGAAARAAKRQINPGVPISTDFTRIGGLWALADELQLQQVVVNLCLNARDASHEGGSITLTAEPVIGEHGRCVEVQIRCRDSGRGMTPEVLARAMEPFFSTKPPDQAVGLGLSIVHTIVTDHGGSIDLESSPGRGCMVQFTLPVCDPPERPDHQSNLPGGRALVIEPNQLVRGLLGSMLGALRYDSDLVASVPLAVDHLHLGTDPFDVLVTSIWPLEQSHDEVLAGLRQKRPGLVVVVVTPGPRPAEPGVALLTKPFHLSSLRDALASQTRNHQPQEHP